MANASIDFSMNINHPGPGYWKALVCLVGYLKVKQKKVIIVRKPKVLKAVIFLF